MCIRDSSFGEVLGHRRDIHSLGRGRHDGLARAVRRQAYACLLYTSDAADERSSVDLGGRRIIKNKTNSYTD